MRNLPNILTILRVFSLPILIYAILSSEKDLNFYAVLLFILIAATDYLDGYFARKLNLESSFGKMLDPIADKLFIVSVIICLMVKGSISDSSLIPAFLIIFREIFISGLREYYASRNTNSVIDVSYLGKIKTAVQVFSLFLILIAPIISQLSSTLMNIGLISFWIAMIIAIISGYQYYKKVFN